MKKVKRLRSTNWQLQNSHEDMNYNIGNIVNNTVITMYGVTYQGNQFIGYINVYPLCCTPENNIIVSIKVKN